MLVFISAVSAGTIYKPYVPDPTAPIFNAAVLCAVFVVSMFIPTDPPTCACACSCAASVNNRDNANHDKILLFSVNHFFSVDLRALNAIDRL